MSAHVVMRRNLSLFRPRHNHALARHIQHQHVTRRRDMLLPRRATPLPAKNLLPLQRKNLPRPVIPARQRPLHPRIFPFIHRHNLSTSLPTRQTKNTCHPESIRRGWAKDLNVAATTIFSTSDQPPGSSSFTSFTSSTSSTSPSSNPSPP